MRHLLECFCLDLSATQTAKMTGLNRNTVNRYLRMLREKIAIYCEQCAPMYGEVELDESYFGGKKRGDKRGRGVTNKVPVFGILKRGDQVYTQIIRNASKAEIRPIIKRIVAKDSTIFTDGWGAYDGLVLDGYKHYRINHTETFGQGKNHINGIENFWGWSKRRLTKFCGVSRDHFHLHLKECEFRFNNRHLIEKALYEKLVAIVKRF